MRLDEITLTAPNLDDLRQFYIGLLGLREEEPRGGGLLRIEIGASRLVFQPAPPGWQGRYHLALDVPAWRFSEALAWLRQRQGLLSDRSGQTQFHSNLWNADNVYFLDPQGNILELIGRHDRPMAEARDNPPPGHEFNASEILGITEIGLCAGSVPDAVAQLTQHMPGVAIYDGQGSDTFTAVGDVHGLLIVVRQSRIWFPDTGVPAEPLPLEIRLEVENGQRYRIQSPPLPFTITPA